MSAAPQVQPKGAQKKARRAALLATAAPVEPRPPRAITIRPATVLDSTPLYQLLIRYFDDLKLLYPPPQPGPTMAWGLSILIKGGVVVAEDAATGELIGSVGLEVGHFPWNPTMGYLNGVWFYVAPERRGGGTAERLIKAAKDIGIQNGLAVRLDNVFGIKPEIQDKFRQVHGFKYVGGNHVWFPPQPQAKE